MQHKLCVPEQDKDAKCRCQRICFVIKLVLLCFPPVSVCNSLRLQAD